MDQHKGQPNKPLIVKKRIKDLVPGDTVMQPIYRSDGLMLVNKNKKLSSSLIKVIRNHVLPSAPVLVSPAEEETEYYFSSHNLEQIINPHRLVTGPAAGSNEYFVDVLSNYPLWISMQNKLESEQLKNRADKAKQELLDCVKTNQTLVDLLSKIKEYDDVLLIHSLNTTCISLMIGLTLELTVSDLIDLAIAALFSNIGFTVIPKDKYKEFLKEPEYNLELIKKHLELFSRLTQKSPLLRKKNIVYGILDHHEYYNGKGCPYGKKDEEISLFGRILLIAHTYDELAGGYNYTAGHHPLEALRIVYTNMDNRFDKNILNIFMHRTRYFKLDETIFLSNHQRGIIVGFDDYVKAPHLPVVRLKNGAMINLFNNKF